MDKSAQTRRNRRQSATFFTLGLIFIVGLVVMLSNVYQLDGLTDTVHDRHAIRQNTRLRSLQQFQAAGGRGVVGEARTRSVCIFARDGPAILHVKAVFERLGYDIRATKDDDWDVLWSLKSPYVAFGERLSKLKPHQKVNHWPGLGSVTSKSDLATSKLLSAPVGYRLPKETDAFRAATKANPDKMWVVKSGTHRGVRVRKQVDNVLKIRHDANLFIQEFISNPFLIDGRKFDIGVYTVITSIDPLRVYTYEEEILLRFCSLPYHPFDEAEVNKYVVTADYTPTWEIPSLVEAYNNFQYSHKQALNLHLGRQGHNPKPMWQAISDSIREVMHAKEDGIREIVRKRFSHQNFFELVRFDFIIDEKLKVYLLEVNMSPNLSSGHFAPNKWLYEQIVYNTLKLVGLASATAAHPADVSKDERDMLVSLRDIQVASDRCASAECDDNCKPDICQLCQLCRIPYFTDSVKAAFLEHVNRGNYRRVIPKPLEEQPSTVDVSKAINSTQNNHLMTMWFRGKCEQDKTWCT
ncbi:probable tubulin polyglutamylase ttll-15 isoform X1 [Oscarella lobularis]|uniref:probable tubulin polyglutamylase ttll-15 isoform X1 n=2 Tax=Oscarella lobularis TaxID=121494 RepID=UPI003313B2C4